MYVENLDCQDIFVIHNFLTPQKCALLIAQSEASGYEDAPITSRGGFVLRKDIRNNTRVMVDDVPLSTEFFEKAKTYLPEVYYWQLVGLNERLRYYRYDVQQKFEPHFDGYFRRENGEQSWFTFMIYLNEDFEGGETKFYNRSGRLKISVKPEIGKALVFLHQQLHEGDPVLKGRKYVVRTDVMYRKDRQTAGSSD